MINAVIYIMDDIVRIDVYNLTNNNLKVIFSKYNRIELSSYIKHNSLKEEGINKLVDILADYKENLNSFNISDIHVYATAFLWNMKNCNEVVAAVAKHTSLKIRSISSKDKMKIIFDNESSKKEFKKKGLLVNISGGSTDIIVCSDGKAISSASVGRGYLNTGDKFVKGILPTKSERHEIRDNFLKKIDKIKEFEKENKYNILWCTGNTMNDILKLDRIFFGKKDKDDVIPASHIRYIIKAIEKQDTMDKFQNNLGLLIDNVPERIRFIMPSMIILGAIIKRFKCKTIIVTDKKIKTGIMQNNISNN